MPKLWTDLQRAGLVCSWLQLLHTLASLLKRVWDRSNHGIRFRVYLLQFVYEKWNNKRKWKWSAESWSGLQLQLLHTLASLLHRVCDRSDHRIMFWVFVLQFVYETWNRNRKWNFNGQKLCKSKFVWTGFLQSDLLRLRRRHLPRLHQQLKLQIAMNAIKYTTGENPFLGFPPFPSQTNHFWLNLKVWLISDQPTNLLYYSQFIFFFYRSDIFPWKLHAMQRRGVKEDKIYSLETLQAYPFGIPCFQ